MSNRQWRTVLYVCSDCGDRVLLREYVVSEVNRETMELDDTGQYEPDPRDTWCHICDAAMESVENNGEAIQ